MVLFMGTKLNMMYKDVGWQIGTFVTLGVQKVGFLGTVCNYRMGTVCKMAKVAACRVA